MQTRVDVNPVSRAGGLLMNSYLKKAAGCIGFLCLLLLGSCGGGGSMAAPPPAGDFTLTVSPASVSLAPGGAGQQISVNAIPANGFMGAVNVAIAGLPGGVTAQPATLNLTPGTAQTVTVTASASAVAGNAMVSFTGTTGALTHSATVTATISAPPPDYTLAVSPSSVTIVGGAAGATVNVTAMAVNSFSGTVAVAITGLPAGVTANPATLSLTPGVAQSTILT